MLRETLKQEIDTLNESQLQEIANLVTIIKTRQGAEDVLKSKIVKKHSDKQRQVNSLNQIVGLNNPLDICCREAISSDAAWSLS